MPNWIDINKFRIQNSPGRTPATGQAEFRTQELRKELHIDSAKKVVLFAHRLSERKGAHYLPEIIQAFKGQSVVFIIIGDGQERQNLEFRIQNLELTHSVRLLGWVPNEELPKYYAIADLFIMPSDEEGFPRVLLEAMARELPFVAFGVGGVPEIVPQELKNFVVSHGAQKQFIGAMNYILNASHEDIIAIQKREKEWVKKFDVKDVAKRFRELF